MIRRRGGAVPRSFCIPSTSIVEALRFSSVAAALAATSPSLLSKATMLLKGHQLFSSTPQVSAESSNLCHKPLHVPRGMSAMGMPSSAAVIEHLASHYAETLTLQEMSKMHHAVVRNAQQTQQFYEDTLLKGFSGGGGGGMVAPRTSTGTAAPSAVGAGEPTSTGAVEAKAKAAPAKTSFNVQLVKFDAAIKIKLIKELRAVTNLALGEAKAVIDKCPGLAASNMSKDDAEKLKKLFTDLGATVELL